LICFAVCVALATAKSVYEPRIINGANAEEGQFPYQVSLRRKVYEAHFCGASILSNRFILTAAHCCQNDNSDPENVYALVGAYRQTNGGVKVELDKITPHKEFSLQQLVNDIALIRTAEEITFTNLIQPIALPTSPLEATARVVLTGWGKHKFPKKIIPDVLQFSELQTIDRNECSTRFGSMPMLQNFIYDTIVCTVDKKNGGACHGDSGGPLVDLNKKTVVGVVSWGIPCAQGYPDVFTRVHSYLDWINENIEEQSSDL